MARETHFSADGDGSSETEPAAGGDTKWARPLGPGLHILSTPIGSAGDLTLRGLAALRSAEILVCEDTRVLRKLMEIHGVPLEGRPMIAYHEHNAARRRPAILDHLSGGRSVLFASDAGTPLIADPGFKLVAQAQEAGHPVSALPGPSALLAALVVSGLPTDAFSFIGFPPPKAGARRRLFERWADTPGSVVLYEAPGRVAATLNELLECFGPERPAAIARELTKRFEEVRRGSLGDLAQQIGAGPSPKGELVLIIGPADPAASDVEAIDIALKQELNSKSAKDAVRTVVELLGAPKNLVYERALAINRDISSKN